MRTTGLPPLIDPTNSLAAKKFPRWREKLAQIAPKPGSMQNSFGMIG
jgi:hypothetical protein